MSMTMERPRVTTQQDVIAMSKITKVYDTGKIRVEALKGVDLAHRRRRVRRDRRAVGLGKVHA